MVLQLLFLAHDIIFITPAHSREITISWSTENQVRYNIFKKKKKGIRLSNKFGDGRKYTFRMFGNYTFVKNTL